VLAVPAKRQVQGQVPAAAAGQPGGDVDQVGADGDAAGPGVEGRGQVPGRAQQVVRDAGQGQPGCLMLTSFGDDEALFSAIMAGAAGYVLKQIRGTDLVGAVRTIASGASMLDPDAASKVMARMRDQASRNDPLAGLSPQERKILELIGRA